MNHEFPLIIERAQFSCYGVIFALHHVALFMDRI